MKNIVPVTISMLFVTNSEWPSRKVLLPPTFTDPGTVETLFFISFLG